MKPFDIVHDPGLQQERTALAWDRTALSLMVASGLLVRVIGDFEPIVVVPVATGVVGLVTLIIDRPRYIRRWRRMREVGEMPASRLATVVGWVTVVLGFTSLLVVVRLM